MNCAKNYGRNKVSRRIDREKVRQMKVQKETMRHIKRKLQSMYWRDFF